MTNLKCVTYAQPISLSLSLFMTPKIHCHYTFWWISMGLDTTDPLVALQMWPQQVGGQRSPRCHFWSKVSFWFINNRVTVMTKAGETRNLYQISTLSRNQTICWNEIDANIFLESLLQEKDTCLMLYGEPWQQLSYIYTLQQPKIWNNANINNIISDLNLIFLPIK